MLVVESSVGTLNSDCCGRSPSLGGAASVIYQCSKTGMDADEEKMRNLQRVDNWEYGEIWKNGGVCYVVCQQVFQQGRPTSLIIITKQPSSG